MTGGGPTGRCRLRGSFVRSPGLRKRKRKIFLHYYSYIPMIMTRAEMWLSNTTPAFPPNNSVFMKLLRSKCKPRVAMGAVEINDRVTIRSAALHLKRVGCNVRSAPVTTVCVGVVEGYPESKYTLNNHSSLFASMYTKQFFKERDSCAGCCV